VTSGISHPKKTNKNQDNPIKNKLGKAKKKSVMMENLMVLTSSLDFLTANCLYFKKHKV